MTEQELLGYLRDAAQGASNSAASTVSAPVDLLAWLLRKGGVPVGDAPVMGSDWMAQKGFTAQPRNALAGMVGETVGNILPIAAAAKAPQIANALIRVQDAAGRGAVALGQKGADMAGDYMARQGMIQPATVWHGSPHKFDKFDASRIGTGEGAQAYGHGLYLADDPRVAQSYKDALGSGRGVSDEDTIARVLDAVGGDAAKAAAELERRAIYANIPGGKERLMSLAAQVRSGADPRGAIYKVDLPDNAIARMLDWDKPLSQQGEVTRALRPVAGKVRGLEDALQPFELDSTTGRTVNDYISRALSPADAALLFKQAGIPGIRYLDGGSRGAGAGTSNYVVFPGEENMLRILERNGVPIGK